MTPAEIFATAKLNADAEIRDELDKWVKGMIYDTVLKILTDWTATDPLYASHHARIKNELQAMVNRSAIGAVAEKLTQY